MISAFSFLQGGIDLNVFEAVKQSVTTRQAAEHYGIRVNRNGMACCPFHNDKTPSMKLDKRFHCFGCGADGDVIDFVAALYGLGKKEAQAPAEIPGRTVPGSKGTLLPCPCRLSTPLTGMENRLCPALPGGSVSSPVRGSLAEASPCGISAGCAAVRGDRGKSGFDYGLRKGCDTA